MKNWVDLLIFDLRFEISNHEENHMLKLKVRQEQNRKLETSQDVIFCTVAVLHCVIVKRQNCFVPALVYAQIKK